MQTRLGSLFSATQQRTLSKRNHTHRTFWFRESGGAKNDIDQQLSQRPCPFVVIFYFIKFFKKGTVRQRFISVCRKGLRWRQPITAEQRVELDRRLNAYQIDQNRGRTAADVLDTVRRRL
jgi:hypothetical protein